MNVAFPADKLQRLERSRVVAGFSVEHPDDAVQIARALLAGGIDAIELTLRTEAGIEAVRAVHAAVPAIFLGVGTILTPVQVRKVKDAGGEFGVAPGMNPKVIREALECGLPFAPGICTPTDLEAAIELRCRLVKFFPAEASGGLSFIKSMAAPYRHLGVRYFPLGGLNAGNMLDYLREDIIAAIGGSWIVKEDLVNMRDWAGITARAAEVRSLIDVARN